MNDKILNIKNNESFKLYYDFLVSENEKYNLTNITKEQEVYYKHFLDSYMLSDIIDLNGDGISLCDVGSGAGFPSIPLKIMFPNLHITIIEPTLKRCNFLKELVKVIKLENVDIINDRAENIKNQKFDIVCARAVSNLPVLLELCLPLAKVNGYFIAMKGSNYMEELKSSSHALKELNSKIEDIKEYELINGEENYGLHSLIKIKKEKEIKSIYPRNYSQIKKKPL